MNTLDTFTLHTAQLVNYADMNQALVDGLNRHIDSDATRKSHHFYGRYENIYIDTKQIPQLGEVLKLAKEYAAQILHKPADSLKAGLWFNVMNPGDRTTLHQHDDDDELLSAVYYVSVEKDSAQLLIGKRPIISEVTPAEGMFVFFPPDMPHEVTQNNSSSCRISLGINIGPA